MDMLTKIWKFQEINRAGKERLYCHLSKLNTNKEDERIWNDWRRQDEEEEPSTNETILTKDEEEEEPSNDSRMSVTSRKLLDILNDIRQYNQESERHEIIMEEDEDDPDL